MCFYFLVIFLSQQERYFWLEHRAKHICRSEQKILYKFYNPHRLPNGGYESLNKYGVPTRSRDEEVDNKLRGFAEYFFLGAKGIITQNVKSLNKSLLLANGSSCRYYGITFQSRHNTIVDRAIETCAVVDGLRMAVVPQPKYIHVFVDGEFQVRVGRTHLTVTNSDFEVKMDPDHCVGDTVQLEWNDIFTKQESRLRRWTGCTTATILAIIKPPVICPCTYSNKSDPKDPVKRMAVALAYAFTFNKLQGLTLSRLVLSIGDNPCFSKTHIRLAHIYVALSRVMASKYLALLPAKS